MCAGGPQKHSQRTDGHGDERSQARILPTYRSSLVPEKTLALRSKNDSARQKRSMTERPNGAFIGGRASKQANNKEQLFLGMH